MKVSDVTREMFDNACFDLEQHGTGQSPADFGQQVMVIALYSAKVARSARLKPLPDHYHPEGMTCNECEEVRLYNERIYSGGTR